MASEDERRVGDEAEPASENERLADEKRDPALADGDPAGADRDPAGAEGVTLLERRARRLLHVYPAVYRRERGEEIIGTLLEATSGGQTRPRVRDVRALVVGGLRARAAQNRQRTVGANLRVAVMAGLAIYTAFWLAMYLDEVVQGFVWFAPQSVPPVGWNSWPAAMVALLAGSTVVLAWTAPRAALLTGVLAATAVVAFTVTDHDALRPHLAQVLGVAVLAALALRAGHPSRHWLWLPGVIAMSPLVELGIFDGLLGHTWPPLYMLELSLLVVVVAGILWIAVDARLMVAVLTYFALTATQMAMAEIPSGAAIEPMLPFVLVVAMLTAASGWLLRRQSARPIRAS